MTTTFTNLLDKYLTNTLTSEEEALFITMSKLPENQEIISSRLDDDLYHGRYAAIEDDLRHEEIFQVLQQRLKGARAVRRVFLIRKWGWAAASILVLLSIGVYFGAIHKKNISSVAVSSSDIAPGRNGAILTLSNGAQIVLDSLGNGVIANQNGAQVRLNNGQLAYDVRGGIAEKVAYNVMTTPRGRQFQVTLSDGTKAWLNAASSLRYPTTFAGRERKVEITGEVYFEVAKNEKMPFKVNVDNKMEIAVLGTDFNVNAYENETSINATLLTGSIHASIMPSVSTSVLLKPGQQAQLSMNKTLPEIKVIKNADIDKVMAWKNGAFYFEGSTVEEIMRQVERWYDVEVVYEKGIPNIEFGGGITRGVSLKGLISALQKSEMHCRLEGRKLIIMP